MSGWLYVKKSLMGDETVGPISNQQLLQFARDGSIDEDTQIAHPKTTKGQWVLLARIPAAMKQVEEGNMERQRQNEAKKEEQEKRKAQAKEEAALRKAEAVQEAAEKRANSPIASFVLDGQSESAVTKVYDRVQELLSSGEAIEYIAVQANPVKLAPDCIVLTNRRFILFRPKLLGRMSFEDFLWRNIRDAHMTEGPMYGTFKVTSLGGAPIEIGYLPKAQARRMYRICQEKEEEAIEERRRREMEENKAGAANVVVNAPTPEKQPDVAPTSDNNDPMEKLSKLKKMLEAGLIEQGEYDENKKRILESM